MLQNALRVMIESSYNNAAPIPFPTDEMTRVQDPIGAFVAWPVGLIEPTPQGTRSTGKKAQRPNVQGTGGQVMKKKSSHTDPSSQATKAKGKKKVQAPPVIERTSAKTPNRARLRAFAATLSPEFTANIPFDKHIFGVSNMVEHVFKEQIMDVLDQAWLGGTAINLWIRHLHEHVMIAGDNVSFEFISPYDIAHIAGANHDEQSAKLKKRFSLKATGMTLFLAPINTGQHWLLLVIYPQAQANPLIYYLDPVYGAEPENRPALMRLVNSALTSFRCSVNLSYSKALDQKDAYKWLTVQCPFQPNNNDCGYYVMQFMRDVVTHD